MAVRQSWTANGAAVLRTRLSLTPPPSGPLLERPDPVDSRLLQQVCGWVRGRLARKRVETVTQIVRSKRAQIPETAPTVLPLVCTRFPPLPGCTRLGSITRGRSRGSRHAHPHACPPRTTHRGCSSVVPAELPCHSNARRIREHESRPHSTDPIPPPPHPTPGGTAADARATAVNAHATAVNTMLAAEVFLARA